MLQHPNAGDYFPDLALVNGRIAKIGQNGPVPLESDASSEPLMDYLNPSLAVVDDDEVIAAAKFIHWTIKHPETQDLQVRQMVATEVTHFSPKRTSGLDWTVSAATFAAS